MSKIQNIISTVNLKCHLDIKETTWLISNTEYRPRKFDALVIRIRKPQATALVFTSGKMVCTGTKSVNDSYVAARKFARKLQKTNAAVRFADFTIHNMVCSHDFGHPIDLNKLSERHQSFYEPEIFPGLTYRMTHVTVLIFSTGKIVITGSNSPERINAAFRHVQQIIS